MFSTPSTPSTPARGRLTFVELSQLSTYTTTSKARLQALYADFSRQKQSSPAAFRANVEWWAHTFQDLIERRLQPGSPHGLILRANPSLPDVFRYEGVGKPLSLSTVVAELITDRTIIPVTKFLSAPQSIYDSGSTAYWLAATLVGKPLWWALQQTGIVGSGETIETESQRWRRLAGDYVVLPLLEHAAERVLEHQETLDNGSAADAVYSWSAFKKMFGAVALDQGSASDEDIKVLVKFLERDRKVVVTDKNVIKFIISATSEPLLSPVDTGLVELKDAIINLQTQLDGLQSQIEAHKAKATESVRAKRPKELALSHLRAAKQIEELFRRRLGALDTLRATLLSVEGAAADISIMKNYENSAATLKAILAHPSLQRERVDETMDALASANADAREIDDAIRIGGQMNIDETGAIDEDEIERELAQLAEEGKQQQEAEAAARLPSAPVTPPQRKETPRLESSQERLAEAA